MVGGRGGHGKRKVKHGSPPQQLQQPSKASQRALPRIEDENATIRYLRYSMDS